MLIRRNIFFNDFFLLVVSCYRANYSGNIKLPFLSTDWTKFATGKLSFDVWCATIGENLPVEIVSVDKNSFFFCLNFKSEKTGENNHVDGIIYGKKN